MRIVFLAALPSESNNGNVTRRAINPFQIPAGLAGARKVICQETAAVFLRKRACKAPFVVVQGTQIKKFYLQKVSWFCSFDRDRPAEIMNLRQIHILHIIGFVAVLNLSSSPVNTFNAKYVSFLHRCNWRDIRVPAGVQGNFLLEAFLGSTEMIVLTMVV